MGDDHQLVGYTQTLPSSGILRESRLQEVSGWFLFAAAARMSETSVAGVVLGHTISRRESINYQRHSKGEVGDNALVISLKDVGLGNVSTRCGLAASARRSSHFSES